MPTPPTSSAPPTKPSGWSPPPCATTTRPSPPALPGPRTSIPPATPTPTSPAASASTIPLTPPRSPAPWTCSSGPPTAPSPPPAGLAAAIRYQSEHSHLRVGTDDEDAYGYRLGQFITGQRTAYQAGALDPAWIAELEDLGMIWDDHEATWLPSRLSTPNTATLPSPPNYPAASSLPTSAPWPERTASPPTATTSSQSSTQTGNSPTAPTGIASTICCAATWKPVTTPARCAATQSSM
ncbi:helicase associated domain-containing protein [Streptomyces sp. NPDC018321]|uniref:helicase associated domain-containing protein n=1 Tax=unclassified Streptomyces TaxID=2593676 RepID=UPI0037AAEDD7